MDAEAGCYFTMVGTNPFVQSQSLKAFFSVGEDGGGGAVGDLGCLIV